MMKRAICAGFLAVWLLGGPSAIPSRANLWPRLGAPRWLVDRAFAADPAAAHHCVGNARLLSCYYTYGSIHITVDFAGNMAHTFEIGRYPRPAQNRYWMLLSSFLPLGSTPDKPRVMTHSTGYGGNALAATYRWQGHQILVSQYLAPDGVLMEGCVMLDAGLNAVP
jgi:hypothetical protein